MLIKKHDESHVTELEDGSRWRIWPGDIAATLQWLPTTELGVSAISDEFCSHALIDEKDGSRVRVIEASADWPRVMTEACAIGHAPWRSRSPTWEQRSN